MNLDRGVNSFHHNGSFMLLHNPSCVRKETFGSHLILGTTQEDAIIYWEDSNFDFSSYETVILFFKISRIEYFDFERTWWRLFLKRVVNTEFDIYVFIILLVTHSDTIYSQTTIREILVVILKHFDWFCRLKPKIIKFVFVASQLR